MPPKDTPPKDMAPKDEAVWNTPGTNNIRNQDAQIAVAQGIYEDEDGQPWGTYTETYVHEVEYEVEYTTTVASKKSKNPNECYIAGSPDTPFMGFEPHISDLEPQKSILRSKSPSESPPKTPARIPRMGFVELAVEKRYADGRSRYFQDVLRLSKIHGFQSSENLDGSSTPGGMSLQCTTATDESGKELIVDDKSGRIKTEDTNDALVGYITGIDGRNKWGQADEDNSCDDALPEEETNKRSSPILLIPQISADSYDEQYLCNKPGDNDEPDEPIDERWLFKSNNQDMENDNDRDSAAGDGNKSDGRNSHISGASKLDKPTREMRTRQEAESDRKSKRCKRSTVIIIIVLVILFLGGLGFCCWWFGVKKGYFQKWFGKGQDDEEDEGVEEEQETEGSGQGSPENQGGSAGPPSKTSAIIKKYEYYDENGKRINDNGILITIPINVLNEIEPKKNNEILQCMDYDPYLQRLFPDLQGNGIRPLGENDVDPETGKVYDQEHVERIRMPNIDNPAGESSWDLSIKTFSHLFCVFKTMDPVAFFKIQRVSNKGQANDSLAHNLALNYAKWIQKNGLHSNSFTQISIVSSIVSSDSRKSNRTIPGFFLKVPKKGFLQVHRRVVNHKKRGTTYSRFHKHNKHRARHSSDKKSGNFFELAVLAGDTAKDDGKQISSSTFESSLMQTSRSSLNKHDHRHNDDRHHSRHDHHNDYHKDRQNIFLTKKNRHGFTEKYDHKVIGEITPENHRSVLESEEPSSFLMVNVIKTGDKTKKEHHQVDQIRSNTISNTVSETLIEKAVGSCESLKQAYLKLINTPFQAKPGVATFTEFISKHPNVETEITKVINIPGGASCQGALGMVKYLMALFEVHKAFIGAGDKSR